MLTIFLRISNFSLTRHFRLIFIAFQNTQHILCVPRRAIPRQSFTRDAKGVSFSARLSSHRNTLLRFHGAPWITLGNSGFIDLLLHGRSRSGQKITRHRVFPHSNEIFSGLRHPRFQGGRVKRVRFKQFRKRDFLIIKVFLF